jgi:hypothetical protein
MCTLSCLQQHPRSTIVADEDATLELKVKTVKVWMSKIELCLVKIRLTFWDLVLYKCGATCNADRQGEQT